MLPMETPNSIYTIGHSNHQFVRFADLLKQHQVTAVADVRSIPYSRRYPQFNQRELSEALKGYDIAYVFLGRELGARSSDPAYYRNRRVQYRRLAETTLFRAGMDRVLQGSKRMRIALMCAEKDPLNCHRTILVARELIRLGKTVNHILADGRLETQEAAMKRLRERLGLPEQDLFWTQVELEEDVYTAQEKNIAYVDKALALEAQEAL